MTKMTEFQRFASTLTNDPDQSGDILGEFLLKYVENDLDNRPKPYQFTALRWTAHNTRRKEIIQQKYVKTTSDDDLETLQAIDIMNRIDRLIDLASFFETLTSQRKEIMNYLLEGYSLKETADLLKISPSTMTHHRKKLAQELLNASIYP